jgi:hypothetical protein
MGVVHLWDALRKLKCGTNVCLEDFAGKTVAVDWACLAVCLAKASGAGTVADFVRHTQVIHKKLSSAGMLPTIVFDGKRSPFKKARVGTHTDDTSFRTIISLVQDALPPTIKWVQAPYEAEAECARMSIAGECWAVVSNDSDALVFGAPRVITGVFGAKDVHLYELGTALQLLRLTQEGLAIASAICGCDFSNGIPKIGFERARHIASATDGDLERCLRALAWSNPRAKNYKDEIERAMNVFLNFKFE